MVVFFGGGDPLEYPDGLAFEEHLALRKISLMEEERIEQLFSPSDGLVTSTPLSGPLLALTNLRVVVFSEGQGTRETTIVPLEELRGVSVRSQGRNPKNLLQGAGLVLVSIISYFIVGLWVVDEGLTVPLVVAISIAFIGFLFLTHFIFWEEEGNIVFQGGRYNWELAFPYTSIKGSEDIYRVADRFLQLKLGMASLRPVKRA